jgi:hypothetical protein
LWIDIMNSRSFINMTEHVWPITMLLRVCCGTGFTERRRRP